MPSGAELTAEWHHDLNGATGGGSDPIDPSHKGPIMAYLAKVDDATQSNVTGLKWFKIHQDGLDTRSGEWAVDKLIKNKGKVNFKLPSCIAPGQYLLRVELIGESLFFLKALRSELIADFMCIDVIKLSILLEIILVRSSIWNVHRLRSRVAVETPHLRR